MNAPWYWTRTTVRRSLGGVVLLVIVLAIGAGGAMGAAAGARRGVTAGDRLAAQSAVPDLLVFAADPAPLTAVSDEPDVAAASGIELLGLQPVGVPCNDAPSSQFPIAVPVVGEPFAVPRPRLMAGRFPDQVNPNEALLSEQHARRLGVEVGDRIGYHAFVLDEDGVAIGCGPELVAEVEVVGIVRELFEIGVGDEPTFAFTYLTKGFAAAHPDLRLLDDGVIGFVDLRPGVDAQQFADGVNQRIPTAGAVAGSGYVTGETAWQPALLAGAAGLWALVAVVALLTASILALGISRQAAATSTDLHRLAILGMDRRQRATCAAGLGILVVGLGLPLAVALAAGLSKVHLIGLAAIVEPDPGFDLDPAVLATGVLVVLAVGGGITAATALRASTVAGRPTSRSDTSARPGVAERMAAVGAPAWAALGTGYALGRGRRTTLPARSALVGVAVGTAGVLGVLLFGLGVDRASTDPAVYGWGTWNGVVTPDDDPSTPAADPVAILPGDRDVAAVAAIEIRFRLSLDGEVINGTPIESLRGRSGPTVVRGRLPVGRSEIALGSDTADVLDAGLGSTVEAAGPDGTARLEVVGIAAFPSFDGDSMATGWTADREAVDALGWPPGCNDEEADECGQRTMVVWRDGVDVNGAIARLRGMGLDVVPPSPGVEVRLIAETDGLPRVAAGVVALLAAAGLAHTLTVTATRRRRELAVVRALGFDRAQVRRVLYVEGLVLGLVGGVLGGVAGLVIGRIAWRTAAQAIGIGSALPSSTGLIAAVLASVAALGLLLSLVPAYLAVRTTPADGLRDEG